MDELQVGEHLQTRLGPMPIASIEQLIDPQPVYTLEINGQHVYEVTELGIRKSLKKEVEDRAKGAKGHDVKKIIDTIRKSEDRVKNLTNQPNKNQERRNTIESRNYFMRLKMIWSLYEKLMKVLLAIIAIGINDGQ